MVFVMIFPTKCILQNETPLALCDSWPWNKIKLPWFCLNILHYCTKSVAEACCLLAINYLHHLLWLFSHTMECFWGLQCLCEYRWQYCIKHWNLDAQNLLFIQYFSFSICSFLYMQVWVSIKLLLKGPTTVFNKL